MPRVLQSLRSDERTRKRCTSKEKNIPIEKNELSICKNRENTTISNWNQFKTVTLCNGTDSSKTTSRTEQSGRQLIPNTKINQGNAKKTNSNVRLNTKFYREKKMNK